jgi:hypothetical protein
MILQNRNKNAIFFGVLPLEDTVGFAVAGMSILQANTPLILELFETSGKRAGMFLLPDDIDLAVTTITKSVTLQVLSED